MPPIALLGRSLLYFHNHWVASVCACSIDSNKFRSSHSCRTVLLKRSMYAFCVGFPGWIYINANWLKNNPSVTFISIRLFAAPSRFDDNSKSQYTIYDIVRAKNQFHGFEEYPKLHTSIKVNIAGFLANNYNHSKREH